MERMGILSMPSGACGDRPLSTLMSGLRRERDGAILHRTATARKAESSRCSSHKDGHSHADRGSLGTEGNSGTGAEHEARQDAVRNPTRKTSHCRTETRGKVRKHWASLYLLPPEILQTHSGFSESNY